MKIIPAIVSLWAFSGFLHSADPAAPAERKLTADEKAVADLANAYEAAYNKGDAKALAVYFSEEAEWVDSEGHVISGRAAIEKALTDSFARQKGRKLDLRVESVRALTPDVLAEKGTSVIDAPNTSSIVNSYTAVRVKREGRWLINQITETGAPLAGNARENLRALEWLVGMWEDKSEGVKVHTTVLWARSGNFLTRTFKLARAGADESEGTEIIGWDAKAGKIRSWVFDSGGGFSENSWTQDGRRWLIQAHATLPDGRESTALHTLTYVSDDKCTWSSSNRETGGELLPNIDPVEMVRMKNP